MKCRSLLHICKEFLQSSSSISRRNLRRNSHKLTSWPFLIDSCCSSPSFCFVNDRWVIIFFFRKSWRFKTDFEKGEKPRKKINAHNIKSGASKIFQLFSLLFFFLKSRKLCKSENFWRKFIQHMDNWKLLLRIFE